MTLRQTLECNGVKFEILMKVFNNRTGFCCDNCLLKQICHCSDLRCFDFIKNFLQIENNFHYTSKDILKMLGVFDYFVETHTYILKEDILRKE